MTASVVLALVFCLLALLFVAYWAVQFALVRHAAYAHAVFAKPLVPNPKDVEARVHAVGRALTTAQEANRELDDRLAAIGLASSNLTCAAVPQGRYDDLLHRDQGGVLIALNLWNNEDVLPTLSRALIALALTLGPPRVSVSVFENGSSDKTPLAMAHLAAVLTSLGVSHAIRSDAQESDWSRVDRIAQLAVYRNVALEPLADLPNASTVLFVNDVYMCPNDALELLHQRKSQDAHAACGLDWRRTQSILDAVGVRSVKFYDNCTFSPHTGTLHQTLADVFVPVAREGVSRSIQGSMFRPRLDILSEQRDGVRELFDDPSDVDAWSRERFRAGLPLPVYSCWNGMVAFDARPFQSALSLPDAPVASGQGDGPLRFRSAFNTDECAASECKILARDFWARGFNRWVLVPRVHVTYTSDIYDFASLAALSARAADATQDDERIDWDEVHAPESVVCYPWERGFHVDLPYRRVREPPW